MPPVRTDTDNALSAEALASEPLIDALCMLPEFPAGDFDAHGRVCPILKLHRELHQRFAARFTKPCTLTTLNGLVLLGEPFKPSTERYDLMPPDKRHAFLNAVRGQLSFIARDNLQIVCLVGGTLLQGIRRLEFPMHCPCAAMSPRMRRNWLKLRLTERTDALWKAMTFGTAAAPVAPRGKKQPKDRPSAVAS